MYERLIPQDFPMALAINLISGEELRKMCIFEISAGAGSSIFNLIKAGDKFMKAQNHFALPGGVGEDLSYGCHNCKHWDRLTDTCPRWPEEYWHKGPVSINLKGCQGWACAYCGGPWWWLLTDHEVCQTLFMGVAA